MKKFLLVAILVTCALPIFAQKYLYTTTAFYYSQKYSNGWSKWSSPKSSSMGILVDCDNNSIYIDSPSPQLYTIDYVISKGYDSEGCPELKLKVIDQDYDRGTVRIVKRHNGTTQIYIIFNNIRWCYDVIFLG